MQERILELIVYLLDELGENINNDSKVNKASDELTKNGFSEYEIGIALAWIQKNSASAIFKQETIDNDAFRVLNSFEKYILTPEVHGYLITLKKLDLINNTDLEYILQKLFQIEQIPVQLDVAKNVIAELLIQLETFDYSQTYNFLFDGNQTVQ